MTEFFVLLNGNLVARCMTQPAAIILMDGILNNFQSGSMSVTIRREEITVPTSEDKNKTEVAMENPNE